MGVDANVITAERIKEELNNGKTLNGAIELGYKRAWSAVFDGNITVVFVAIILMGAFGPTDSVFENTSQPCILSIRRKHSRYYLFTWIYSPCRYPPELCIRYLLFKTYAFVPLKVQVL